MTRLVAVDIGGTHARFALAEITAGRVVELGQAKTLKTAEHASLQTAWEEFGRSVPEPLPKALAMAVAAPVSGGVIRFTNNPWVLQPGLFGEKLGVDHYTLINDFAAVGHAVAQADPGCFEYLCGPDVPLPESGTISIVGPGTGLGVAHLWRGDDGYRVQATEGGHIDFAPLDAIEDQILSRLRRRYLRVSVERVVSGPGLVDIYQTLAAIEARAVRDIDDLTIWSLGLANKGDQVDEAHRVSESSLAAAAIDRFCLSLGSVVGDITLAQGGGAVVIAGGLGLRIRHKLVASGFATRFCAKGRFAAKMAAIPVKIITHPQPGLFGAAAAFAQQFSS